MINEVFELINYVADKNGRGYIPPASFSLTAKICQLEFLTSRLGNIKTLGPNGVPPFGYKSTRRVSVDLLPFLYGPVTVPIESNGNFAYPYGFMWPDAWHKNDFTAIKQIETDEYPAIKHSTIHPPTSDYPVLIFRNPYGFIDPYSIGSFQMSYIKIPPDPVWGFDVVNDVEVYNESLSTDFVLRDISFMDISMLILEKIGVNLDKGQLLSYSMAKQAQGS